MLERGPWLRFSEGEGRPVCNLVTAPELKALYDDTAGGVKGEINRVPETCLEGGGRRRRGRNGVLASRYASLGSATDEMLGEAYQKS